jgi:hypothetical protein
MNGDSASPRVCERVGSIAVAKPSVTSIIMQGRSDVFLQSLAAPSS